VLDQQQQNRPDIAKAIPGVSLDPRVVLFESMLRPVLAQLGDLGATLIAYRRQAYHWLNLVTIQPMCDMFHRTLLPTRVQPA
jgi:hypothetical protein